MNDRRRAIAQACLEAAEHDRMTFPEIVGTLIDAGFERYAIDFQRGAATYYHPDGDPIDLPIHRIETAIAPTLDTAGMQSAIREAQQLVEGYSYKGFCEKAAAAGCASYIVSFSGRRALYFGRTAEIHVERFPD